MRSKDLFLIILGCLGGASIVLANPYRSSEEGLFEDSESYVVDRLPLEIQPESLGLFSNSAEELDVFLRPESINRYLQKFLGVSKLTVTTKSQGNLPFIPQKTIFLFPSEQKKEIASVESWDLRVVDQNGRAIFSQSGVGAPSSLPQWDGTREGRVLVSPGQLYSMVFTYANQKGEKKKIVGAPQAFPYFIGKQERTLSIFIANGELRLENTEEKPSLLIQSVCQTIADHPGAPVAIDVFAQGLTVGQDRLAKVQNLIADQLLMDKNEILTDLHVDAMEPEEIQIHLLGAVK